MKSYYVYVLTDPRKGDEPFYCGKGSGDRWKSHLGGWANIGKDSPTSMRIKEIQEEGLQPGVIFIHENITDESLAYDLEEAYIKENFEILTNRCIGKIPKSQKGRTFKKSEKACKEQSERLKKEFKQGTRKHWTVGKSKEEIKDAISRGDPGKANRGKRSKNAIAVVELTTMRTFESILEASKELGVSTWSIREILNGNKENIRGLKFEYKSEV